jgi:transposase
VLEARAHKTDHSDARGIADLMRTGTYRQVHQKSIESRQIKAMLTARRLLAAKALGMENSIRGILMSLGFTFEAGRRGRFAKDVGSAVRRDEFAASLMRPLLHLRATVLEEVRQLDRRLAKISRADPVCRLLMTAPGVGPITALAYRSAIDDPGRFTSSRCVAPLLGLVPKVNQSGQTERRGHITKAGDGTVRSALYIAAIAILRRGARTSWLRTWGEAVAARRGKKRALIAVARRLAVVLHRMWASNTTFRSQLAC